MRCKLNAFSSNSKDSPTSEVHSLEISISLHEIATSFGSYHFTYILYLHTVLIVKYLNCVTSLPLLGYGICIAGRLI